MEKILKDPKFQEKLAKLAEQTSQSHEQVNNDARRYLKELYAVHQPISDAVMAEVGQFILSRGYDKTIDTNPSEIKALTKLMYKHPIAFVMTHKTYIDMFVLGLALVRHGLPIPYTFSGINMSFLGLGQIARKTGVIFIRRSFKDNEVYKATLRHFISSLVNDKTHFMWAIEGTRSRTGKLVWPKMGILKYIMEGEAQSNQEVKYIPVSIVYDLIPDVKEMTEEGMGKSKNPESLTWFLNYIRKMGNDFGKISLRLGEPIDAPDHHTLAGNQKSLPEAALIPKLALRLVHRINKITPVTTTSLICISLLSKYALGKIALESDIADLMHVIESHKSDALVDRGKPIGQSVQDGLNLLTKAGLIRQQGDNLHAKYTIVPKNYLSTIYYANMAVHHLYRRAFIELVLMKIKDLSPELRSFAFWTEIMKLRSLFKFEFFFSDRPEFCDEVEEDFALMDPNWQQTLTSPDADLEALISTQKVLVAPVVLHTYIEAYRVIAQCLLTLKHEFEEKEFVEQCLTLGGELQWQGRIQHVESVSKPFLVNGIRLAKNRGLIPTKKDKKQKEIREFLYQLDEWATHISSIQRVIFEKYDEKQPVIPIEREIVPGSKVAGVTQEVMEGESGAHIGAFFDLDRTLIKGFSAIEFAQARVFSGKITAQEIVAQFAGVMVFATGNGNFAGLAAISAKGVKGIKEEVFIEVGEDVYQKHLASEIYPEARALVAAHMAKGHTVAIVSAATPYQTNPIARDLGIEHVLCTRMEVKNGEFTGKIVEPACWGEGKAFAGKQIAKSHNLDLSKSYFYTDSASDVPLLEIVGNPRPINPDTSLAALAFQNNWPISRFNYEERPGIPSIIRTGLTAGSLIPAALTGVLTGVRNLSWQDGVNSMMAAVGDLGTAMAGIKVVVKNESYLWSHRPAVFIFSHQSNADLFIMAKLLRKDARPIAKKEIKMMPIIGQLMMASGVIFVDRKNREKAIEAMKPAVEALKNGVSVAIAPEGTRSYSYKLGKFKKGAFHLAMQGGVPMIPVVIKNAHDAMPRGSNIFRPTAVEVVVLPPVPTEGWKRKDLDTHIAEVRGMFLEELGQEDDLETPKKLKK